MSESKGLIVIGEKALDRLSNLVPVAQAGQTYLFEGEPKILGAAMQELTDRFALRGEVCVITGANRISFDRLPLLLNERAGDLYEIADHILISRAETCHQLLDALKSLDSSVIPLIVTDILESFLDEDLSDQEVQVVLAQCLEQIAKLADQKPVLISVSKNSNRANLLKLLEESCDTRFYFKPAETAIVSNQPFLF